MNSTACPIEGLIHVLLSGLLSANHKPRKVCGIWHNSHPGSLGWPNYKDVPHGHWPREVNHALIGRWLVEGSQLYNDTKTRWTLWCMWFPWGYSASPRNSSGISPDHVRHNYIAVYLSFHWRASRCLLLFATYNTLEILISIAAWPPNKGLILFKNRYPKVNLQSLDE